MTQMPPNFMSLLLAQKCSLRSAILAAGSAFPLALYAAPSIQTALGNPIAGETIVLEGRDFTTMESSTISFFDNIENQSEYSDLSDGASALIDSGPWQRKTSEWSSSLSITRSEVDRSEKVSAMYEGTGRAYIGWPRALNDAENKRLYVSWWFKPFQDPNQFSGHNKFIRVWDSPDATQTRVAWNQRLLAGESVTDTSWAPWNGLIGEWNRLEYFVDGVNGEVKAWTNGQLIHYVKEFTKNDIQDGLDIALLGFDPNYGEPYKSFRFLIDDIYLSTSPARVELSNSSVWTKQGMKRELQTVINWSNQEISFKYELGSLDQSKTIYAYVIDNQGLVNNNGFPIDACSKCPEPIGLTVD